MVSARSPTSASGAANLTRTEQTSRFCSLRIDRGGELLFALTDFGVSPSFLKLVQNETFVQQDDRGISSTMKLTLDTTDLNAGQIEQLKTLMALLAKAQAFRKADVRVVHHYAQQAWEREFTFESLASSKQGYMRGRGSTIQRGDHVVLQSGSHVSRYQIDEIDYDAQPADVWIALLHPCSERVTDRRFWMQPAAASGTSPG